MNQNSLSPSRQAWQLPFQPAPEVLTGMETYVDMLSRWNSRLNLSGFSEPDRIMRELVCDSFHLASFIQELFPNGLNRDDTGLDLGAGAGLPGIPLRLLYNQGQYVMIEAREKRALFLSNVLAHLRLPRAIVHKGRVEDYFQTFKPKARYILSRAFRPWPELLPLCRPFLAAGGQLLILAVTPPACLPADWRLSASRSYPVNGKERWLWALTPHE